MAAHPSGEAETTSLFDPVRLGDIALPNRIVMAPMTRSRADAADAPTDLHVTYYRQRASAGLIIAEGTQPSANGKGYCRTPGIHTAAQVAAWRRVTDAVHEAGGRIALQLMHVGRIASHLNKAPDAETVAPSAVRADVRMVTEQGEVDVDTPRALETEEIAGIVGEYAAATRMAMDAGFDGVELHCTSGYLPAQFLSSNTNLRTDQYGGSADNRVRFVVETLAAMSDAAGPGRVGFRICPGVPFNDLHDADPAETHAVLLDRLAPLGLAWCHLIHVPMPGLDSLELVRRHWTGNLILNEGMTRERGNAAIANDVAQAVSFGRPFIANPDLVERLRRDAPLADFDPARLYSPGPEGYIDYPPLSSSAG